LKLLCTVEGKEIYEVFKRCGSRWDIAYFNTPMYYSVISFAETKTAKNLNQDLQSAGLDFSFFTQDILDTK
jgi:hypothetical protein